MATSWPNSVQTFSTVSSGDSLNSPSHSGLHNDVSDTVEALQNYAGLVLITPTSVTGGTLDGATVNIGSGVSSVTVTGAFSSTFDNYKISVSGITMSASTGSSMHLRMSSGGTTAVTNYQYGLARIDIAAGTIGADSGYNSNVMFVGKGVGDKFGTVFDVLMPYVSTHTIFPSIGGVEISTGYSYIGTGQHQTTASYDGFSLLPSTGTLTGGTIRVYGYNNG